MNIFIKSNHKSKGIDRFLQSFSIHEQSNIIYVDSISEANTHETDIAVYGGFLPQDLIYAKPKFKYYTFCSPLGQADLSGQNFLSPEIEVLYYLIDLVHNGRITKAITPSQSLYWRFPQHFIYIPPIKIIDKEDIHFTLERQNYSIIGNNFRKHRNVVNQIAAVSKLTPKQPIFVTGVEFYKPFETLFDCEFYSTNLSDKQYYETIAKHKLNFQCSWSESFSYITLEYAMMGVPTIVGPAIDWLQYDLNRHLKVENPDDAEEIFNVAQDLLYDDYLYNNLSHALVESVFIMNKMNREKLYGVINESIVVLP